MNEMRLIKTSEQLPDIGQRILFHVDHRCYRGWYEGYYNQHWWGLRFNEAGNALTHHPEDCKYWIPIDMLNKEIERIENAVEC